MIPFEPLNIIHSDSDWQTNSYYYHQLFFDHIYPGFVNGVTSLEDGSVVKRAVAANIKFASSNETEAPVT